MDTVDLLAALDEKASLEFLARMLRHKSYSATPGERELAAFMVERMRDIGLEAELTPVPGGRVNAIGRWRGTGAAGGSDGSGGPHGFGGLAGVHGAGKSLLFNGHLDTNPVSEGWTVDPWGGLYDDEFIYGNGVSNMKAGDAAYYCAVKTLIDQGVRLPGDVVLTYVVGELQGGIGTVAAIDQGIKADYFVNAEPTDVQALTMHAGSFVFVIEITGNTRHLSKREEAADAIMAGCWLVPRINAMTFSGAASERHASINRAHVGVMRGGLGREMLEWRAPQVADFVRIQGSARYAPGQSEDGVMADLRRMLDEMEFTLPGIRATVTINRNDDRPTMLPFEVAPDNRIVQAVNQAYRRVRGVEQPTGALRPPAFYGTDAAHFYQRRGMAGVVCGPGGKYNTMPDERVDIADYLAAIRVYMLTILDICG
ncbi:MULTISPECIES: M20 family metallopeptidase [unclassified Achromobacter]|uniref:M20 family metallopeptidase n=1 Tax=unclassified Achromobacter TaxID=2626865 RepID=UPI000B51B4FA|nr:MULTISPECIES: M20/M25/M40 family metallo-hydrolase [unclassified Achromobacter]OWT80356.1 acetylornithine deacetylase [Achromobacter sp. HZ34]OWT82239.1 acetylornithine deacetylase [Achromobacter sp. HZ28]